MSQGRIGRRYRHAEPRGDRPSSSKNARPQQARTPDTRTPERATATDYRNATSPTGLRNFRECNSPGFADIASHARTAVIKCSTFDA
ncbi:hypothetical protein CFREN_00650 [Corynebacterium freneyi]|nr:hypothetical protein CFREN_00650 [Corynebacterium freneyi]